MCTRRSWPAWPGWTGKGESPDIGRLKDFGCLATGLAVAVIVESDLRMFALHETATPPAPPAYGSCLGGVATTAAVSPPGACHNHPVGEAGGLPGLTQCWSDGVAVGPEDWPVCSVAENGAPELLNPSIYPLARLLIPLSSRLL